MLLTFLYCLSLCGPAGINIELRTVDAAPLGDEFDALKQQLRDPEERERRKAVQGLVKLGTDEAWELVLDSLKDPMGQVADQVQLDLVELPVHLRPSLFGKAGMKSRSELVPLRVAEALGRMGEAQSEEDYLAALQHKDPEVKCSLLWSIERLAERRLLGVDQEDLASALEKLAKRGKDARVRAHALLALAALQPSAALPIIGEFAGAKDIPMRCAATELIPVLAENERLPAGRKATADPAFVVRLRAYEVFAGLGNKAGMGELIEALGIEQRRRCTWHIVALLRENSGMKYGLDPRPWTLWLSELPEDWTVDQKHKPIEMGGEQTASFVGMKVVSDRVAFLIDFSGSMWQVTGGKSRKDRVDVEMRRVLEGLDKDVRFNLHPYHSEPLQWQKKLTAARPKNVKNAIDYFEKCKARGVGDFWMAALETMDDPDVDTLMMLGDGAPSGGRRWNMKLMKELFLHENRFRGIALDALLVDCSGGLSSQWEYMSEGTGGRCVGVDL